LKNALEMPWLLQEREERGFAKLGFEGVLSPLYRLKPETRTCPGQRPDMSGENCLGSSENFKKLPKNSIFN
jgi:hypothetical protein